MFKKPLKRQTVEFRRRPNLPEEIFGWPVPAASAVPKWYRDMPLYTNGDTEPKLHPGNSSPKACVPVLDAISAGYVFVTPHDIEVRGFDRPDRPQLLVSYTGPSIIKGRDEDLAGMMPAPAGYTPGMYIWHTPFEAITPPGYSMLYTHPMNNFDVPFITASGIMDTDHYGHSGSIPFHVRMNWEGIIPKGTPYLQMIPFRREPWKMHESKELEDEAATAIPRTVRRGYYRDNWWQRKDYK